jgi:hypothetical protein
MVCKMLRKVAELRRRIRREKMTNANRAIRQQGQRRLFTRLILQKPAKRPHLRGVVANAQTRGLPRRTHPGRLPSVATFPTVHRSAAGFLALATCPCGTATTLKKLPPAA